jgi:branched-chain amino acid transport system substrate-binding protein
MRRHDEIPGRQRWTRLAVVLAGGALAVTGCGGSGQTAGLRSSAAGSAPGQSQLGTAPQPAAPAPGNPQAPAQTQPQNGSQQSQAGPGVGAAPGSGPPVQNPAAAGAPAGKQGPAAPKPAPPLAVGGAGGNFASDVGVTKDTVNIGSIAMASATRSLGPPIAEATLRTTQALVKYINDTGGVAGRRLNLIFCDDGGDVTRARACYERLKTQVFAFVPSETWLTQTIHAELDKDRVPYLSWGWFQSEYNDPYMFPCHANGAREATNVAKWVAGTLHPKTAGIMYLNDAEDIAAKEEGQRVLEQNGIRVVQSVAQEWDSPDESQHVLSMRVANPDVILVYTWPTPLAKFMHDAAGQNWSPPMGYVAKHVMGDPGYGQIWGDYAKDRLAVIASYLVPGAINQSGVDNLPAMQLWRTLTAKYTGYDVAGFHMKYVMGHHITQAAIACTQILADVARKLGPNLTRTGLLQALESGSWDTGMGVTLRWPHGNHGQEPYPFNHEYMYMYASDPSGNGFADKRLYPDPLNIG